MQRSFVFAKGERQFELAGDDLEERLNAIPDAPAVYILRTGSAEPHLARTGLLRRRLRRLARRGIVGSVEWWASGCQIEASLTLLELAREYYPDRYLDYLKLRPAFFLRLLASNPFPRTRVTARISNDSLYYGPFRTRAAAEHWEQQFLDLFQIRRCQEELAPSPDHPGCVYGEMNRCLRPCQQAVTIEEYASEAARAREFLATNGRRLLDTSIAARERLSEQMDFEAAAREHKRAERSEEGLRSRDDLATDASRLCGVTVGESERAGVLRLWFMSAGVWLAPCDFDLEAARAESSSMDARLRQLAASLPEPRASAKDRQEHAAILVRWFFSSWRKGDWIPFEGFEALPYRRLVQAISRAARSSGH